MKWYVLYDAGTSVSLILDYNTTPLTYFSSIDDENHAYKKLESDTTTWSDKLVGTGYRNYKARFITTSEVASITQTNTIEDGAIYNVNPAWLVDNTWDCASLGCNSVDSNEYSMDHYSDRTNKIRGYFTMNVIGSDSSARVWTIHENYFNKAMLDYDGLFGVRPVISVKK